MCLGGGGLGWGGARRETGRDGSIWLIGVALWRKEYTGREDLVESSSSEHSTCPMVSFSVRKIVRPVAIALP